MSVLAKIDGYIKTYGLIKALPLVLKRYYQSSKARKELASLTPILDKEYGFFLDTYSKTTPKKEVEKNIFFYWQDGEENLTEIGKLCYEQIKRLYGQDYHIYFVDKNNYTSLVKIDPMFINLFRKKKMTIQTFSDVLRFALLDQIGGVWIDSTLYLPERIEFEESINQYGYYTLVKEKTKDFFSYKGQSSIWSTFCIGGSKNNPLFNAMEKLYLSYYSQGKKYTYFLTDIFLMLCCIHEVGEDEMRRFANNNIGKEDFSYLSEHLLDKASDEKLNLVKQCPQKLNWRIRLKNFPADSLLKTIYLQSFSKEDKEND